MDRTFFCWLGFHALQRWKPSYLLRCRHCKRVVTFRLPRYWEHGLILTGDWYKQTKKELRERKEYYG